MCFGTFRLGVRVYSYCQVLLFEFNNFVKKVSVGNDAFCNILPEQLDHVQRFNVSQKLSSLAVHGDIGGTFSQRCDLRSPQRAFCT